MIVRAGLFRQLFEKNPSLTLDCRFVRLEDAGASDAADWAIARSLSALRSAEQRGELSQPDKDVAPDAGSAASLGEADSKGDRSV